MYYAYTYVQEILLQHKSNQNTKINICWVWCLGLYPKHQRVNIYSSHIIVTNIVFLCLFPKYIFMCVKEWMRGINLKHFMSSPVFCISLLTDPPHPIWLAL